MHKVLQGSPDPPSALSPGLPQGFDAVVARALAKKPEDRFASARDFGVALRAALQGRGPGGGAPAGDPERTLPPEEAQRVEATRTSMRAKRQLSLSPEVIAELERSLSRHIGPMARVLVKQGQAEAADMDEFCRILAESIPDQAERTEFMAKVALLKKRQAQPAPPSEPATVPQAPVSATAMGQSKSHKTRINFTPEALATAEKRLASFVGPLAKMLTRDAATRSSSLRELYTSLAANIDSEEERQAFLAMMDH
jgi:serine/threonine-protein kinase